MRPVRDPLRSLIYHAADRAVRDVHVDGNKVVENGEVLTLDMDAALDVLQAKQDEAMECKDVNYLPVPGLCARQI